MQQAHWTMPGDARAQQASRYGTSNPHTGTVPDMLQRSFCTSQAQASGAGVSGISWFHAADAFFPVQIYSVYCLVMQYNAL
jgi:hypothetical protein